MKKTNKYLITLILVTFLLTGCNSNNKNNIITVENNKTNENTNIDETKNNNTIEKKGHTLNSKAGQYIIEKDGSVYYIPSKTINVFGTITELTEQDLSVLGNKKEYINYTYQNNPLCTIEEGCAIESYKLDLTNISSAYEVMLGNDIKGPTIIFLSYDGLVHELNFNYHEKTVQIVLTKNISQYPNIVSVVTTMSYGGHGAMLIDINGNKYNYIDATKNN